MIVSVQPSGQEAGSSSARLRSGLGPRRWRGVGIFIFLRIGPFQIKSVRFDIAFLLLRSSARDHPLHDVLQDQRTTLGNGTAFSAVAPS